MSSDSNDLGYPCILMYGFIRGTNSGKNLDRDISDKLYTASKNALVFMILHVLPPYLRSKHDKTDTFVHEKLS